MGSLSVSSLLWRAPFTPSVPRSSKSWPVTGRRRCGKSRPLALSRRSVGVLPAPLSFPWGQEETALPGILLEITPLFGFLSFWFCFPHSLLSPKAPRWSPKVLWHNPSLRAYFRNSVLRQHWSSTATNLKKQETTRWLRASNTTIWRVLARKCQTRISYSFWIQLLVKRSTEDRKTR